MCKEDYQTIIDEKWKMRCEFLQVKCLIIPHKLDIMFALDLERRILVNSINFDLTTEWVDPLKMILK